MHDSAETNDSPARSRAIAFDEPLPGTATPAERTIYASFWLPGTAFGAAATVDDLFRAPTVSFIPGRVEHQLILRPDPTIDARALMRWMNTPAVATVQLDHPAALPWSSSDVARVEKWMQALAARLHLLRAFIADAAERIMWDAADGLDTSLPPDDERLDGGTLVSMALNTRVVGPSRHLDIGVVEADWDSTRDDLMVFIDADSQHVVGWRRTIGASPRPREVYTVSDRWPQVTPEDLMGWYQQHLYRERLYDAAWLAITHHLGGIEPVQYRTT